MVKETILTTDKGFIKDDFLFYKDNNELKLAQIEGIIKNENILILNSQKISENKVNIVAQARTLCELLAKVSKIELFVNDNILTFNLSNNDKRAEVMHLLKDDNIILLDVKLKEQAYEN